MIIRIRGAVVHRKRWNDESARMLIVQNMLAQGGRQHVIRPSDRGIKCCTQGGRCPERVLLRRKLGSYASEPGRYVFRGQFRPGPISVGLPSRLVVRNTNNPAGLARRSFPGFGFRIVLRWWTTGKRGAF